MIKLQKTQEQHRLPFFHPAALIATFIGVGRAPFAAGTLGSLAAFPFLLGLLQFFPQESIADSWHTPYARLIFFELVMVGIVLVITVLGVWASHVYVKESGTEDPGAIVIDEVAGQILTLAGTLPVPLLLADNIQVLWVTLFASFVLFRLCDILKPWPVRWFDQHVKGGLGVMMDDIAAGVMAIGLFYIGMFVFLDFYKP